MKNFAETVRDSADIIRVVSDYVSLKGAASTFKGLCPFHSEKTPSFSVHREKQLFHCFGCGVGGDVFSFIMLAEKVSFPEAVRMVAEKCGIPIPSNSGLDDKKFDERQQLFEICERASAYFRQMLSTEEAREARQVLQKREIQPAFADRFYLGYAPASGLMTHLRLKDPVGSGLFIRNDRGDVYERFRRRLMFPIWNERGKTIAFGGRALAAEAQPKYLNSAESPLYSKSYVLYALHLAREVAQKAGRLVVVEGYFDCVRVHQAGFPFVVALMGSCLSTSQERVLAERFERVLLMLDGDAAGRAASRVIRTRLCEKCSVALVNVPEGAQPDPLSLTVIQDLIFEATRKNS